MGWPPVDGLPDCAEHIRLDQLSKEDLTHLFRCLDQSCRKIFLVDNPKHHELIECPCGRRMVAHIEKKSDVLTGH